MLNAFRYISRRIDILTPIMPKLPDFSDPRYLNEVGWFLYHEKHQYQGTDRSYAEDRML